MKTLFKNKKIVHIGAAAAVLFIMIALIYFAAKVLAVDQIKSSDFFVFGSDVQVSSATTTQFSVYIGDNLAGVTNPVKSVYFIVSGVYTGAGGGSLELKIDNNASTTKTFSLPAVSNPTPFEILYKDDSGLINPASAGVYTYTLYLTPSGVTISGLSAKATVSHRYVPGTCPDGQPTSEKIKSSDFFVFGSDVQVSSATTTQFSVYIGDNLAGVTNPIKSVYFTVSGVYTGAGGGSLELKIDNNASTTKTFSLPAVSSPTPFEFIYKDDSGLINPVSAGVYTYTLYLTPSGVTISGLSAKATVSHRYKPPSCGAGFSATGEIASVVFDTGSAGAAYNSAYWKGTLNSGKVKMQLATSNCSNGKTNYPTCTTGDWTFIGGSTCSSLDWYDLTGPDTPKEITCAPDNHNNQRYFRYKLQLCSASDCSSSGETTPQVDDAVISWSP